jgi:hypothetical protein
MKSVSINKLHYCGIDLHADVMYACVMTKSGKVVFHHEMPTDFSYLFKHLKPYLSSIAVCAESTLNCHCRSLSVKYPVLCTDIVCIPLCHCRSLSVKYPVLCTDIVYRFVKELKPRSFQ